MYRIMAVLIDRLPMLVIAGLLLVGGWFWPKLLQHLRFTKFPKLGKEHNGKREEYAVYSEGLHGEGYAKFHDDIYRLKTPDGEHIVIPNKYLDELRQKSDDEIDVLLAFMDAMENRYLGLFPGHTNTRLANSVVKQELTRSLVKINPGLSRQVDKTVAEVMPPCEEWTPVNIHSTFLRIVAIVSGHVFVGPDLCRREEYLKAALDFTTDIVMAVPALKRWPKWLRPIGSLVEPQVEKVREHRRSMRAFLAPVIAQRRAAKARGEDMPEDTLQWMMDKADAQGIKDDADLTNMQLLLTMAAIHTTTLTATFIIYDMVARPEVVKDCRREIQEVLQASNGVMTTNALFNMKLVDSVMRESQRMNPPFIDAFRRYTLKPIVLSDGTEIPAGCLIESANKAVLMDPNLYPEPEKFDPYRFMKLRTTDIHDPIAYKNREQYQFVSVTKENMSFGFGRHACPGRFFAANEIKLILAQLLLNFDMKLPEETPTGPTGAAPRSRPGPDPTREILFRKVE